MKRALWMLLISILTCQFGVTVADDGPAKNNPDLAPLTNYVGDFGVTITSKDSPFAQGESSTKWILDGAFIQQSGTLSSADGENKVKVTTLMTYDKQKKVYRVWSYFSSGESSEATGKWDAKSRTMTSVGRKDDLTTTTIAKFAENGDEEWSIVTTNSKGEAVAKFTGVNKRRKN